MAQYSSSQGASVEGEKLMLSTRQFFASPPVRCPTTKKKQYRFHLGMRADATIHQAYENPPENVFYTSSFVNEGDQIQGSTLSGWAWKALGPPNVEKCSGTHSGSVLKVTGGCLAQVDAPSREHLNSVEISSRNPPIDPVRRQVL
jgi:hypothetical protein